MTENIGDTLTIMHASERHPGFIEFSANFVYMCNEDKHIKNFQDASWVTEHVGWNLSHLRVYGSLHPSNITPPLAPEHVKNIMTVEYESAPAIDLRRAKEYVSTLRRIDNRLQKFLPLHYYHQAVFHVSDVVGSQALLVWRSGNPNSYPQARYNWFPVNAQGAYTAMTYLLKKYV